MKIGWGLTGGLFLFTLSFPVFATTFDSWRPRRPLCSEWMRTVGPRPPYQQRLVELPTGELTKILKHYGLKRVKDLHGLPLIDSDSSDENTFEGHAVEVALKLRATRAYPGRYELLPVESRSKELKDNGLFFVVIEKISRQVVAVLLGNGGAETAPDLAEYAEKFKNLQLPIGREWRLEN